MGTRSKRNAIVTRNVTPPCGALCLTTYHCMLHAKISLNGVHFYLSFREPKTREDMIAPQFW